MQEKYDVTGMTCAACQARVQKSVACLNGVQECNVNLLKNSIEQTKGAVAHPLKKKDRSKSQKKLYNFGLLL